MFDSLLETLRTDHERCLSLCAELIAHSTSDEGLTFHTLRTFKALATAQMKAEEYSLYALFDVDKKPRDVQLQSFALEGYEKHDLIDKLLKEMNQAEEVTPQWKAQLKVMSEILRQHLSEEKDAFFPRVEKLVSREELRDLAELYRKERDAIFTKRSGLDIDSLAPPPAPVAGSERTRLASAISHGRA